MSSDDNELLARLSRAFARIGKCVTLDARVLEDYALANELTDLVPVSFRPRIFETEDHELGTYTCGVLPPGATANNIRDFATYIHTAESKALVFCRTLADCGDTDEWAHSSDRTMWRWLRDVAGVDDDRSYVALICYEVDGIVATLMKMVAYVSWYAEPYLENDNAASLAPVIVTADSGVMSNQSLVNEVHVVECDKQQVMKVLEPLGRTAAIVVVYYDGSSIVVE